MDELRILDISYPDDWLSLAFGDTVCTVGMFDGVHRGHQLILRRLRELACERGREAVVVTFDRHPRLVLGNTDNHFRLLSSNRERFEMMRRYGADNIVVVRFTSRLAMLSAWEFFQTCLGPYLHAKTLLVGYDNMFGNKQRDDFDRILAMPDVECVRAEALVHDGVEISSTQIRRALQQGDMGKANAMLGYDYQVEGTVVHGHALGRTIEFPTANIRISDPMKAMPKEGVYAVRVAIDGTSHKAMANWGGRPTIGEENPTLEVHLLDYEGDLYGRSVSVSFVARIRDIVAFENLDTLSRQLQNDREAALEKLDCARNVGRQAPEWAKN